MKKIAITLLTLVFIYFGINVSVKGIEPDLQTLFAIDCSMLNEMIENEPRYTEWGGINHYDYKAHNPVEKMKLSRLFFNYEYEPEDARYFITVGFLGFTKSRCFDRGYIGQKLNLEVSDYIYDRFSQETKAVKKEYGLAK